jgi:hypothetical protein
MEWAEQELSEFDYTVIKPPESGDYKDALIEKTGLRIHFTINDIDSDRALIAKQIKENKGQLVLEAAKIENITSFHPFVLDLTEEQLHTCALLYGCMERKTKAENNLVLLQKQDESYEIQRAAIMTKFGFVDPEPATEEAVEAPTEEPKAE